MTADTQTINRLQALLRLYQSGYQSVAVDKTVEKLMALERARLQKDLEKFKEKLIYYESQYGMSTEEFYDRFRSGELGDDMDFVEWSIFRDMAHNAEAKLTDQIC
ncbi:MAG: hypothetical protein GXP42_12510 [Chloroflexi bacterium]|nr:hypothetical protein [Chloroflexota bacterium]